MRRTSGDPLYRRIYDELRQEIVSGAIPAGGFLPSERDLCARFAVDRITVRRSLDLLVEDGLVEKQAGVGTRVRTFPQRVQALPETRSLLFALPRSPHAMDRITEPFHTNLFHRLEQLCADRKYSLVYATLGSEQDLDILAQGGRLGGIYLVSRFPDRLYETCLASGIPSVVVNNERDGFVCVNADQFQGAHDATRELCRLGHRRIATLTGTPGYYSTTCRLEGFTKALANAGGDAAGFPRIEGDWTFGSGYEAMKALLAQPGPRPTALFAQNDLMAIGAMEAIREAGLSIPDDMSVFGFDDVEQSEFSHPKLSTVHVDVDSLATNACRILMERLQTRESAAFRVVVPTRLVIRQSVARVGG